MRIIADFHIHSKYSRATSPSMDIENISRYAKIKGINLVGTGDFTHPDWLNEIERDVEPLGYGFYKYKDTVFVLTAEICNIFYKNDKGRRIHNVIIAPSFECARKINHGLEKYGSLEADGRPMLDLDAKTLVKIVMDASLDCMVIPGHIWTPWFSLFGSKSGFDKVEDCFEEQTKNIYGLETGLSSDPEMNWRLSALDKYTLLSNSDAHSPRKLGREANVFDCSLDYKEIMDVIRKKDRKKFLYTVEFFPEEGKYHYDGHRNCNIVYAPEQTIEKKCICPNCGRRLTVGVMNRVATLGDRKQGFVPENAIPFKRMIPLYEIIAEVLGVGKESVSVEKEYMNIVTKVGTEFDVLLNKTDDEIRKNIPAKIANAILNVRNGRVDIAPGYDGVFGTIKISKEKQKEVEQLSLF